VKGLWCSPGHPVPSTNKTDRHDITEILLKVALNHIKQTNKPKTTTIMKSLDCALQPICKTCPNVGVNESTTQFNLPLWRDINGCQGWECPLLDHEILLGVVKVCFWLFSFASSSMSNCQEISWWSLFLVYLFVWCGLTPLSTIFQLYRGGQFYWLREQETGSN
jgi:hypothetical protein